MYNNLVAFCFEENESVILIVFSLYSQTQPLEIIKPQTIQFGNKAM